MVLSTTIIRFFGVVLVLLSITYNGVADAFSTYGGSPQGTCLQLQRNVAVNFGQRFPTVNYRSRSGASGQSARCSRTRTFLVSEEDVLEAVEHAETLWEEALEARKTATALVDQAEEDANTSAGIAKKAENIFQDKTTPVTMEELVQVDSAAKVSLDATILVNKAMEASDKAEAVEAAAEEALKKSEETLDQHLIDFPDSPLAE